MLDYRDATVERLGVRLVVAHVQDYIDDGRLRERPDGTRNPLQTVPLLDAIEAGKFDAVFGGGRRDEEKARAKERVFSLRDSFGAWDPRRQRPELWDLYNGKHAPGEHVRVFPLSNWTELDVWRYIEREGIALPDLYYAHEREVFARDGMWLAPGEWGGPKDGGGRADAHRPLPHRRRHELHRGGRLRRHRRGRRDPRAGGVAAHRARRDAGRRPDVRGRHGGPQEAGVLLMTESTHDRHPPSRLDSEAPVTALAHDPLAPAHRHDLLRLATAGSVDDGKSTLVGRLLYDTKSVLADQLDAVERVSRERGLDAADLALLTDGLRAEREQGITIDVAYRYFSTATRSYVLADTPGHVQYTRNMVTGASTAELALILIDARHGVVEQTRRHLAVTGLLGVRHVAVAVNKMDLVDWSTAAVRRHRGRVRPARNAFRDRGRRRRTRLGAVRRQRRRPLRPGGLVHRPHPARAPRGRAGRHRPVGPAAAHAGPVRHPSAECRAPDYRGYAGRLASGVVRPGDEVIVLPAGRRTTVAGIDRARADGSVESLDVAFAPQSVVLRLTDDIDVSRGDLLAAADDPGLTTRHLSGTVAVLSERPLRQRDRVLLRVGTRTVRALVDDIVDQLDIATMEHRTAPDGLALNAIGRVRIRLAEDVAIDDYRDLRRTGAFLLIDEADGSTLAAGMADAPDRSIGEGI